MIRRTLAVCGLLIACCLGIVAAASAAGSGKARPAAASAKKATPFLMGVEDNAQLLGNANAILPDIQNLGPKVFRFTIFWSQIAKKKPIKARDSDDPAYDWAAVDQTVSRINALGIPVLLTLVSTPAWAGGGGGGLKAPTRMNDLQDFAFAAASRYNGTHLDSAGAPLPKVNRWEAWNEPNLAQHLVPQWTAIGTKKIVGDPFCFGKTWVPASPTIYRGILNAIYRGVHAAGTAASIQESVAGGATAPYGKGPCASVPGFAPLAFLRDLVKKPVSLDVWSHHPYRNQRQNAVPYKGDNVDIQGMPRLYAALDKAFPGRKILVWVTEFGSQTNPPDKFQGVTLAQQTASLKTAYAAFKSAGRVKMLIWFLVRDEDINGRPFAAGFQSGLEYFNGKPKPVFAVFKSLAAQS